MNGRLDDCGLFGTHAAWSAAQRNRKESLRRGVKGGGEGGEEGGGVGRQWRRACNVWLPSLISAAMKKSGGETLNDPRPRFIGLRLWAVIGTLWPISE